MIHNFSLPRVLCRFDIHADKELFVKYFQDDFDLILCDSDQEAHVYLNDPDFIIHAFVLDQNNLSSHLPAHCKLTNPDSIIIMLHQGIEVDSIVTLLDSGKVDKCIAKPYNCNLLRSDIFTSYMGISNHAKTLHSTHQSISKPAVLVVDDEVIATKFLKKQLDKMECPCDVLVADNAELALDIFEQNKDRIAIIISDQRMPGMQGNQLLTEIKKHKPSIIRMLTSAYEEVDIALNAVNEGKIFRYIKKPWNAVELNETIKSALTEFQFRTRNLNQQQTDIINQYKNHLSKRRSDIIQGLKKEVDDFTGKDTLTYFFECLDSIKTLPPNSASLRASQHTDLEAELVSEFIQMMLDKIQAFSIYDSHIASEELLECIQKLFEYLSKQHSASNFDMTQLIDSKSDLALIDCLRLLLKSSGIKLSSLEFNLRQDKIFVGTSEGMGIAIYKHMLSPQTQITRQMLEQQCELLTLIMLCHKQDVDLHITGKELQIDIAMQLPRVLRK